MFDDPAWLDSLRRGFDYDVQLMDGWLPVVVRDDIVGPRVIGLPFSDFVPVPDSERLSAALGAITDAFPDFAVLLKLGGDFSAMPLADQWQLGRPAVHHRVALGEPDAMWDALGSAFRRGIRKAEKDGVTTTHTATPEALERFYGLFAEHRRRKFGLLTHPRAFFAALADGFFPTNGHVAEAWHDGQLAASFLMLEAGGVSYYKLGASNLDLLECRPNNLLFWRVMQDAAGRGLGALDLGMSWLDAESEGILRFKDGMGGRRLPITQLKRVPASYPEAREQEAREALRRATSILTARPMTADEADAAGAGLFRYFT